MKLRTFGKSGVHPRDNKGPTRSVEIRTVNAPDVLTVALHQHIGAPAKPVVEVGDSVLEEQVIGTAQGFVSTNVHAPAAGTVTDITEVYLSNGVRSKAVVIEVDPEGGCVPAAGDDLDWKSLSRKDMIGLLSEMGVVGRGGAAFPTHVKYSVPKGSVVDLFVVDGVECEPYLSGDHRSMLERTQDILDGIEVIRRILTPQRVVIAIENNKPDAIAVFEEQAAEARIEVVPLKVKYPQGDEKQVLKALTGLEVPAGGLPIDIGAVVSNVGTVIAVYDAVIRRRPLIERAVTVSGGAVAKPANLRARIGTPIGRLFDECGGFTGVPEKVVVGGPMMGFTVYDLDVPLTKGTSGLLALTSEEVAASRRTPCIGCGSCVTACPLRLNPTRLFKLVDHLDYERAAVEGVMACNECGCCAYVCPAHIPLVQGMRLGKRVFVQNKKKASA